MEQNSSHVIIWAIVALIIGGALGYYAGKNAASLNGENMNGSPTSVSGNIANSDKAVALHTAMRKLWEDHITWTRLYIVVEAAAGHPGADETAARLLKNQEDIGSAIAPYYGDAAGTQLTALLKAHIEGAVDVLAAAKAKDQAKLEAAKTAWFDNGNQVADLLSQANAANWPQATMRAHMKDHLELTLAEAVDQLNGNYDASIAGYDKVHAQMLEFSDALSDGIIAQFPDRF